MEKPDVIKSINLITSRMISSSIAIPSEIKQKEFSLSFNFQLDVKPTQQTKEDTKYLIQDIHANLIGTAENENVSDIKLIEFQVHSQMIFRVSDQELDIDNVLREYQWYFEALASFYVSEILKERFNRTPFSNMSLPINI